MFIKPYVFVIYNTEKSMKQLTREAGLSDPAGAQEAFPGCDGPGGVGGEGRGRDPGGGGCCQ